MICATCGEWADVPQVDGQEVVCPHCGIRVPILRPPTLFLTGASGTGKSSVARRLGPLVAPRIVVLEQDVLWVGALQDPTDDFGPFRRTWLRMVAMLNQSGRPSLLCGTVAPPEVENRPATTDPPMSVLDTTHATVEQSAQAVADWALAHCPAEVHSSDTKP